MKGHCIRNEDKLGGDHRRSFESEEVCQISSLKSENTYDRNFRKVQNVLTD